MRTYRQGREFALEKDRLDGLKSLRDRFYTKDGQIYMDGNSLGLCSVDAENAVLRAVSDWKEYGIGIWNSAPTNYFLYHEAIGAKLAKLIGAQADEVTVCANTTLNVHQCIATFYRPTNERFKIIVDELNFPTDLYAVTSQIKLRGYDPEKVLKVIKSRNGNTLDESDIIAAMTDDVALCLLPSVLYRSAQLLDMERLTFESHKRGIIIGFDLCHSIGNIDHDFAKISCDFAVWCNYKYLSGGPGAIAGLYINKKHFNLGPGMAGWWGNRSDTQFELRITHEPERNAGGWQTGTGSVLSLAAIDGALDIYNDVSVSALREKSLDLTAYLMFLIDTELSEFGFSIGNPRDDRCRGGHVALRHSDAVRINEALKASGVVPDFRYPDVIRLAPVPQYTRYIDIYNLVEIIKRIMNGREYEKYSSVPGTVA